MNLCIKFEVPIYLYPHATIPSVRDSLKTKSNSICPHMDRAFSDGLVILKPIWDV